jgi:bifunctional non-homologous end joining protein LigD
MTERARRFVVHEHHAKHLHYDFRLEIGGALKSWAVPKGPSLNPADRRLAVMVADHDLAYADFEGIIPAGQYGAGSVLIWDSGEFIPRETDDVEQALREGKLSFELKGRKLRGSFTLARMKNLPKGSGKEWLLIKKKDGYAQTDYVLQQELTAEKQKKLKGRTPPCETE